jgi:AraC-like DNA-binding protein
MTAIEIISNVARRTYAATALKPKMTPGGPVEWSIRYMVDNHASEIRLSQLAGRTGMSRFKFARRFRMETGMTPGAFLKRVRMCEAMDMLLKSETAIQDIARQVGYRDPAAFSRAFLQTVGTQPRTYRDTRTGASKT